MIDAFAVNFCIWYEVGVQLHFFFHVDISCHNTICFEETILSPLKSLGLWPCQKSIDYRCMSLFWTLNSIPIVYMSILILVPQCIDYYNFVVSFEIGKCDSSKFFLISQY